MEEDMDEVLDEIVKLGSKMKKMYKKRTAAAKEELPRMAAELGIFLVSSSKKIAGLKGEKLKIELNKVQKKVDNFRKFIFKKKAEKL
jgi:hypothetical protein